MSEVQQTDRQVQYEGQPGRETHRLTAPYKSPVLAAVMSMMPGMGQVYLGYYSQGFQNILTVAFIILLLNMGLHSGLQALLGIFIAFFWIFNMVDAFRRAHHVNRALDGMTAEGLPEDFAMPGLKGSLPMGLVLIVAGSLIFLNTKFNYSMDWLEDWWPVFMIIAGIWLVVKSRQK